MPRRRRPWIATAAAAGLGAVGIVATLITGGPSTMIVAVAGVITGLFAAGSLITAAARLTPVHRRQPAAWRWLAAGSLTWLLGVGLRPAADGTPFVLTFADLLVLAGSLLLAIGCGLSVKPPAYRRGVLRQAADAYLGAASIFAVGWVTLLGPVFREADNPGAFFFTMALPALSLLAACAVASAIGASRSGNRLVGLIGVGVLGAITVSELATALARLNGDAPPLAAGLVAPAAFLVFAIAPWAGRGRSSPPVALAATVPPGVLGAAMPLVLVAVAAVVLTLYLAGGRDWTLTAVASSVVLVLLGRLFALITETAGMRRLVDLGERQLRRFAESTGDVVLVCDHEGFIHEISRDAEAIYGYHPGELVSRSIFDYIHPEDVPGIRALLSRMAAGDDEGSLPQGGGRIACRIRAADGTWRPTESAAISHLRGDDLVLVTVRDMSDQVALRNQVNHLTFHDGVTGLPNRAYFEERVREVLTHRAAGGAAVIFLDLDRFTAVNDSVGHASGDYLLGQAARRLRSAVRADDTLARWGGDEFAVLLEGGMTGSDAQTAVDLAERLVRAVSSEPFRVADRDMALTASVGVAFAEQGLSAGDLLRNADVAMSRAKDLGGRRVEVFATHMHADVLRRLEIASDLQRALLENQFAIEYQPVVDLASSRVTAVEALVRWWRGDTFVPPEQFLGPAEDTGLIVPLGEWILREACREVAGWRAEGWDIGLSLNLSVSQITAPRFVETVSEALADSGLPAEALTLEVIEEMLMEDAEETVGRLSELRALGVRLAIDDFGTGYASLAFLRQLSVDMIKIDPSFVAGLGHDETLSLLTRTIVQLGHDLGLVVVAEGIERPEQLDLLREMGCTRGQGYLVARPMTACGIGSLMRTTLQSTV